MIDIDQTLLEISKSLGRLEEGQQNLHRELLGNGQKGRIQKLEDDVDSLKNRVNYTAGAAGGISIVLGFFETFFHSHLFRK